MMCRVLALFVILACVVLAGCIHYRVREDNWFHPSRLPLPAQDLEALNVALEPVAERVEVIAVDGVYLRGLWVHSPDAAVTVYYLGGDSFVVANDGVAIAKSITSAGANVFMLDYRGYGGSDGTPEIASLMSDAEAGLAWLRAKGAKRVVVHGFSMGSFVAAELALRQAVEGLVLESTATNVRTWARHQVPWFAKPFVRIDLPPVLEAQSNLERLQTYSGPLLLLAGGHDRITPVSMARTLADRSVSACKKLVEIKAAGHGDVLHHALAREAYLQLLAAIGNDRCLQD